MQRPPLPDKDFFSMGETCRIAQVPSYTLRYWEGHFSSLKPARRGGGHRRYSRGDLETIFSIKDLIQRRKMTVAGARRALIRRRKGDDAAPAGAAEGETPQAQAAALKLLREVKREIQQLMAELSKP